MIYETEILISGQDRLSKGRQRSVYMMPGDNSRIVKVFTEEFATGKTKWTKRFIQKHYPNTAYRFLKRHVNTYIDARMNERRIGLPIPMPDFFGMVQTDLGVGSVEGAVIDENGNLGPRLGRLVHSGQLNAYHIDLLNDWVERMMAYNIVVNDLHPGNLVLGHHRGIEAFYLVDGIGDANMIPKRTLLRWENRRSFRKKCRRMAMVMSVKWDDEATRFIWSNANNAT